MKKNQREAGETFDAIVIGSSPLLLLEALYLERKGHRVAVVEKRDRLGGAWYTIPLWEFESVEVGCHYIEREPRAYAFLQECLGVALEPHSVKATWFNADKAPEDEPFFRKIAGRFARRVLWRRLLSDDVWGVIKGFNKKDPAKCLRAMRRMFVLPPYRFPARGVRGIVDPLVQLVASSSIELLDNSFVEYVVAGTDGHPNRCCIDGRTYYAKRLVIGQHVYPKLQIFEGDREEAETHYAVHVLLRIAGEKRVPFGYLEIHRNDLLQRVQDNSASAVARDPNAKPTSDLLICCHLTKTSTKKSKVDTTEIFEHLLETGMLKDGAQLLDSHVEHYPWVVPKESELPDAVTVLRTFDLALGLGKNSERWKSIF